MSANRLGDGETVGSPTLPALLVQSKEGPSSSADVDASPVQGHAASRWELQGALDGPCGERLDSIHLFQLRHAEIARADGFNAVKPGLARKRLKPENHVDICRGCADGMANTYDIRHPGGYRRWFRGSESRCRCGRKDCMPLNGRWPLSRPRRYAPAIFQSVGRVRSASSQSQCQRQWTWEAISTLVARVTFLASDRECPTR